MNFIIEGRSTLQLLKESSRNLNISVKDYFNIIDQLCLKTENYEEMETIKRYIIKKLNSPPDHWIKIYKTLKMICYLVKGGSSTFIQDLKYEIKRFEVLSESKYSTNGVENSNIEYFINI